MAHRLSTVRNADLIVVMDHGDIIECGTHYDLVKINGVYADLVHKQTIGTNSSGDVKEFEQEEIDTQRTLTHQDMNVEDLKRLASQKLVLDDIVDLDTYELKLKKDKEERKVMRKQKAPTWKVLQDMRPEWWIVLCGALTSVIAGGIFPIYAFMFSKVIVLLSDPSQIMNEGPFEGTNLYALIFVFLGLVAFIGFGGQNIALEVAGENYTKRLRAKVFRSYLQQEVGFFDDEDNNTGSLVSTLAVDARNVNEMVTRVWGDVIAMFSTICIGLIVAMIYSWTLTLIVLCFSPIIITTTAYERSVQKGFEDSTKKANAHSGKVAGEAIREIRTISSLNKQAFFEERYVKSSERPHRMAVKKAYMSSIAYSLNKAINIYTMAVAFYAGVRLIMNGMIDFSQMFTSMTVIMTSSESAGRSSTFLLT